MRPARPSSVHFGTRPAAAGLALGVTLLLAGCGLASHASGHRHGVHVTGSTGAAHTVRVAGRAETVRAGRQVELLHRQRIGGQRVGIDLVMQVGRPTVSRHALSAYADAPQRGMYLTFDIGIRNHGQATVLVKPTDFTVAVGGEDGITSYDGNAPYSGAHQQLDATALRPGQSVRHPLTYDVGGAHGVLSYAPERKPMIRWRF